MHDIEVAFPVGGQPLTVISISHWEIESGAHVAVCGPSGCGKTTFLHVISGLLSPTRGTLQVCGNNLERMKEAELDRFRARHIGYIFQSFNLLRGFTALENVLLGMTFSGRKGGPADAADLLKRVGLAKRMRHYPSQLSIGEQQRVAVARAVAHGPELILADEPTGSLDPANSDAVINLLREICFEKGCTLILVSHEESINSRFEQRVSFLELNQQHDRIPQEVPGLK